MRISTTLAIVAICLLAERGDAATIDWTTNKSSFVGADGQNSISLTGTLVDAVSLGHPNAAPVGAVKVSNDGRTEEIKFRQSNEVLSSSAFPTALKLDTGDPNWDAVIKSADWCGAPNPVTITLEKLNAGSRYQLELFVYDERDVKISARTATFDDGEGNKSATIRQDAGISIIGTFLADGSKQAINLTQGNAVHPTMNAYILRRIR